MSGVPVGWESAKLKEVVWLRTGPFGSSLHKSDYVDGGVPVVNPMHIENGIIEPSSKHRVSEQTAKRLSEFRLSVGDVVLGRRGEMGRCAVVSEKQVGWLCGTGSLIVRPRNGIDSDYLQGLLSSHAVVKHLSAESVGTTMVNLNQQILLDLDVLIPPRQEQVRIVEKLGELLSDLEAGVAELKAAQRKLAQYRQSLLKAAVEGALTADWRAAHGQPQETGAELLQRILSERRVRWEQKQLAKFAEQGKTPPKGWQANYAEPDAPDLTDLPLLPDSWVWASVAQIGEVQLGRQRSPDKLNGENPTAYIRAANITESGIDLTDVLQMDFSTTERETFALKQGDVLLTEASGSAEHVGRPAIWTQNEGLYCFQNTVLRFTPDTISADFGFSSFLAMQKLGVFSRLSGGVGINHLSAGKFSRLPIALPPLDEQQVLTEVLKNCLAAVAEQQTAIEISLRQAAAQRMNLLNTAFSGQLVPQDPNDEPASELLARLRAERASNDGAARRRRRKSA